MTQDIRAQGGQGVGASFGPGSRPSDQATLRCPDASRFDPSRCRVCDGEQWTCENHRDRPWDGTSDHPEACGCGAGAPCLVCRPDLANAAILHALERAIALIESAEKDTNWTSGDPYGDSATVELRKILASAGEAGTATTVEQGVVHEHATGKAGDAQPKDAQP